MMKLNSLQRILWTLVPACLALVACGGGGSGRNFESATSTSFSPTTAQDKETQTRNVPLHWVYVVNNEQPVNADALGLSMGVKVDTVEVEIDPADLQRRMNGRGSITGSFEDVTFTGSFTIGVNEELAIRDGKTAIQSQSTDVDMKVSAEGDSFGAKLKVTTGAFEPNLMAVPTVATGEFSPYGYEWLLDREDLDQLPIGHVETVEVMGKSNITLEVTDEDPLVRSDVRVAIHDEWTVLEKLPTMEARGKTYSNVVKLSRKTSVPDFSGSLTPVTAFYWVAKGVGMIKGQGVYRIMNVDNLVFELAETNLSQ